MLWCGCRMTSTGTPSGRSSVIGLLVLAHAAGDMRRDLHADRLGPAAVVTRTGASWARPCRRCRRAGRRIWRHHQATGAIIVAQHDDAATAQFGHCALTAASAVAVRGWVWLAVIGMSSMALTYDAADCAEVNRFCASGVPDKVSRGPQGTACQSTIAARKFCWSTTTRRCARFWPSSSTSMMASRPSRSAPRPRGWKAKLAHYDAILLDIGLPDMDGRELCKLMRRQGVRSPGSC